MKKIISCMFSGGGAFLSRPKSKFLGYTLAEIVVVMLIIAVIVAVSIGITKAKLDNVVSYTYYNAYSSLRKISTEMLADWEPQDPEYKQAFNSDKSNSRVKFAGIGNIVAYVQNLIPQANAIIKDFETSRPGGGGGGGGIVTSCKYDIGPTDPVGCRRIGGHWCITRCGTFQQGVCNSRSGCYNCLTCDDTCNKSCNSGFTLDTSSCTCKCTRTCGSGYKLDSSTCSCVLLFKCWDGSYAEKMSSCPKATCWNGTQAANPSSCPSKIKCWDGSYVTNQSQCPSYVTCWNGNKAYNWSGCPACTNKPSKIPCGQSWDENTCKLTGTAKTCPSGQHLNSSCNCVNDCPSSSELTSCRLCNEETGAIITNEAINRTCSEETYEWSEEQCKCIPSPRTLPRKGENFCKLFERHANIMSGSEVCSGSVISNGTTNFADKKPDITLRNGLRVYNMHTDARAISDLANNTQGGVYDGVPNTNSYGYTVYVDIDGSRGDSQLWVDVFPFYITLSGKIIPGYDSSNLGQSGGDSTRYLQVSVENENYVNGKRSIKWLAKSVPFKEGACIAGYVGDATPYCRRGTAHHMSSECDGSDLNSFCRVKQIQPVKFFF